MRNFKIILLFIFLAFFESESIAQKFGVKAGSNRSSILKKDKDDTYFDYSDKRSGFHVGGFIELPISGMFSFQPEILLSTKGYKRIDKFVKVSGERYKYEQSMNPIYVDILLLLKGNFDVSGLKIYGALGSYVGFGVGGESKNEWLSRSGQEVVKVIKWGNDEEKNDLKRLDAGLSIGAGVTINQIQFGVAYDFGLANISPYTENGLKINNRVVRVSVGYIIWGSDTDKE